jgi:ketosteroid isomerase-like protein
MSEQANAQAIQEAYAAFKRGEIQTILNSVSENVEWIAPGVEPVAGTYHGRDGVATFFRKVNDLVEFANFEPREYVAQGERVVALGSYRAKVRANGRFYQADWAMAFTFAGGKIVRFQEFTDTGAIAAAFEAGAAASA